MRSKSRTLSSMLLLLCIISGMESVAQSASAPEIFAHNDYEKPLPFYHAYRAEVHYIEADVFLREGVLLVAHTPGEIDPIKTLQKLYIESLAQMINQNKGFVYSDTSRVLTLMIDLKSNGMAAIDALNSLLQSFPTLTTCKTLRIAVSGDVPDTSAWKSIPDCIYFDGRPGRRYTEDQLKRIVLISAPFQKYSTWNGTTELRDDERLKLLAIIRDVHAVGKPIRLWASPDSERAWQTLSDLGIDVINTDKVREATAFIKATRN